MLKTITVRLPKKLKVELENITKNEKLSKSNIIREALDRYISIKKFRKLRKKVLPFAESQGLLTDDDVFRMLQK